MKMDVNRRFIDYLIRDSRALPCGDPISRIGSRKGRIDRQST